jgi:hypothetical protein
VGKRSRRRAAGPGAAPELDAPESDYADAEGNVLTLRGAMSPKTRSAYAAVLRGETDSPGAAREDAWHRAAEFLFERLAVRWVVSGLPVDGQKDLLARYRFASAPERDWIRAALREHLAEHFPEVQAP